MSRPEEDNPIPWDELLVVGRYPDPGRAHEHGLVILAMGGAYWVTITEDSGEYMLLADRDRAQDIQRELQAYDREQAVPKPPPAPDNAIFRFGWGWDVYGIWVIAMLLTFFWQNKDPSLVERAGSSNVALFQNGELWRPFTALFLHADPGHLLGNLLSGMLFGTLVARSVGPWRGWGLILACGTLGNIVAGALAWPAPLYSIGASTAVFGALGILSGLGFSAMLSARFHIPLAKTLAPVVAGLILLGWLGAGSPDGTTDVLGHVCGFASGLIAGFLIGHFPRKSQSTLGALPGRVE